VRPCNLKPQQRDLTPVLRRSVEPAGLNVQHWVEDAPVIQATPIKPVLCQACTKLHFINISNGKLLGEREK
jgi:hypothetical protein